MQNWSLGSRKDIAQVLLKKYIWITFEDIFVVLQILRLKTNLEDSEDGSKQISSIIVKAGKEAAHARERDRALKVGHLSPTSKLLVQLKFSLHQHIFGNAGHKGSSSPLRGP